MRMHTFTIDNCDQVVAHGPDGGTVSSHSVEALLLHAILMHLQARKPGKLIGWRTDDYLMETADEKVAKGWAPHLRLLPIFEGDPHTKLKNGNEPYDCSHPTCGCDSARCAAQEANDRQAAARW